jgi:predicted signal transduction protein with EAL and GGDEF domain
MPAGIVENYEALLSGSDVTQLRDDLAALDALLIERWGRVDNGASIGFWNLIDRAADEIVEAIEREDQTQVSELVKKLTKTIKSGKRTVGLMDEIARLHVQKSVVAAREWKRQVDMKQMVTSEQMLVTMTMLAEAVRNACSDTSIPRNRIAAEVAKAVLRFRDGETANQN